MTLLFRTNSPKNLVKKVERLAQGRNLEGSRLWEKNQVECLRHVNVRVDYGVFRSATLSIPSSLACTGFTYVFTSCYNVFLRM